MISVASSSAPVLAFPYELICQIFLLCLPHHGRVLPSEKTAPLLLAQICSHWRAIAVSIPRLWNSIFLDFTHGARYDGISALFGVDSYPIRGIVALVEGWFARAGELPLSITVDADPRRPSSRNPPIVLPHDLLSLIIGKSTQWGRIELRISARDFEQFNAVSGPFPVLRTLAIDVLERISNHDHPIVPSLNREILRQAPVLQAVRLGHCFWRVFSREADPSLDSVTAIEFWAPHHAPVASEYLQPLGIFRHLRHLKIHSPYPSLRHPQRVDIATILHLETLILTQSALLLNFLRVPTLLHLDVGICPRDDFAWIVSFVKHSGSNLTRLRLPSRSFSFHEMGDLLAAVPTVVDLALDHIASHMFEVRCQELRRSDLLPRLRFLRLRPDASPAVYSTFLSVLRARPTLLRAELGIFVDPREEALPPPSDDDLAGFAVHLADGMRVLLSTQISRQINFADEHDAEDYNILDHQHRLPSVFAPFESPV